MKLEKGQLCIRTTWRAVLLNWSPAVQVLDGVIDEEGLELSLQVSWWEYSGLGGLDVLQALAFGHSGPQPSSALKCGLLGACFGACMPDVLSGREGDKLPSEVYQNPCFYRAFLFG